MDIILEDFFNDGNKLKGWTVNRGLCAYLYFENDEDLKRYCKN